MEIKVNKEIMDYHESVFMWLNMREVLCVGLAAGVATGVFFLFQKRLGVETTGWICILCAAPFGGLGFVKINGLRLEEYVTAFVKTMFIMQKTRIFISENFYDQDETEVEYEDKNEK